MKINKRIFAGMAVFILLFGVVLAGCISFTPIAFEETETSKEMFKAISDSFPSRIETSTPANPKIEPISSLVFEQKVTAGEILSVLINKYPGLTEDNISGGGINCTYQGKKYYINCDIESTGLVTVVGKQSTVNSIFYVKERMEPDQSTE